MTINGRDHVELLSDIPAGKDGFVENATSKKTYDLEIGDLCGSFKIEKFLGEGGMGQVFLASRTDDLHLRAAVKTISVWSPRLKQRFLKEVKLLSGLRHPRIANLLDAGERPNGQPWFAMEFIEGQTLDDWLKSTDWGLRPRLHLFLKICTAVEHAHRQMVIHRDLKPGNVMITPDGEPVLLDFGVATMMTPETGEQEVLTRQGERLLTPGYASPEQLLGERLSATSDVYSLGVLLHELLTGSRPYQGQADSLPELLAHVTEKNLAAPGATGKGPFAKLLKGDLDRILLKALQPDQTQRYPTVACLADDCENYLAGRPIKARRATGWYRFRKFAGRHRLMVALTACLVMMIAGFSLQAWRHADQLREQRDLAQREKDSAEAVTRFLTNMFEQVDPNITPGGKLKVQDMMAIGQEQLSGLAGRPELQQQLNLTMGRAYRSLGLYQSSENLLKAAMNIDATVETQVALAWTYIDQGRWQKVVRLQAFQNIETLSPSQRAQILLCRGRLRLEQGDYLGAEADFNAVVPAKNQLSTEDQFRLRGSQAELAQRMGRYDEAVLALDHLLKGQRAYFSGNHTQLANTLSRLGEQYRLMAQFDESACYFDQAETMVRTIFGEAHPQRVPVLLQRGALHLERGEFEVVAALAEEGLAIVKTFLDDRHPLVSECLALQGQLAWRQKDYHTADRLYREVMGRRQQLGTEHPLVADSMDDLASLLWVRGSHKDAEQLFRQVLTIRKNVLGPEHPDVGGALNNLALMVTQQGKLDEARDLYLQCKAIHEKAFGPDHLLLASSYNNLAGLAYRNGKTEEALELFKKAVVIREKHLDPDHPKVVSARCNIAIIQTRSGRLQDARDNLEPLAPLVSRKMGADHLAYARVLNLLADVYHGQGLLRKAEPLYQQAVEIRERGLPVHHKRPMMSRSSLAKVWLKLGKYDDAQASLDRQKVLVDQGKVSRAHAWRTYRLLALLASLRGDDATARDHVARALSLLQEGRHQSAWLSVLGVQVQVQQAYRDLPTALEALARARALVEDESRDHAFLQLDEAGVRLHQGDLDAARDLLAHCEGTFAEDHASSGRLAWWRHRLNLAVLAGEGERLPELLKRARSITETYPDLLPAIEPQLNLAQAETFYLNQQWARAEALGRDVAAWYATTAPEHPHHLWSLHLIARSRLQQGYQKETRQSLDAATNDLTTRLGAEHGLVTWLQNQARDLEPGAGLKAAKK